MDSINIESSEPQLPFSNQSVVITELPDFEKVDYTPLHPDYLKVMFIIRSIYLLIVLGLWVTAFFMFDENRTEVLYSLTVFLLFIPIFGVTQLAFARKRYAFREHDAIYKSGLFVHKTVLIPFNRIQHVSIEQGPIMRIFGLAKLSIFTAGGMTSDLDISGIKLDVAEKLKAFLSKNVEAEAIDHSEEIGVEANIDSTQTNL